MSNRTVSLTAVKTADKIKLEGVTVTLVKGDHDSIRSVLFCDGAGNQCRVTMESYNMQVFVPAPPKIEKRYVLRAELPVVGEIKKVFEHEHEAEDARRELSALANGTGPEITAENVEVEGAVIVHDEIPF